MNTAFKQRGMSGLGFLVMLLIIGFVITALIKVLPIYIDSWTVKGAVQSAVEAGAAADQSSSAIRKRIERQFTMNQITVITPRDVKIERKKNGIIEIDASYEARVQFIQNLDVVVRFENLKFEVQPKQL